MKEKTIALISNAAEDVDSKLAAKIRENNEATILYGRGGVLDSLGLVHLIIAVETAIADEFQVNLTLANERAISQRSSPFRTVGTLADYIVTTLKESNGTTS
jgi:D-alanine--poly(phosphoribitol) ligase subunit 2